MRFRASRSPVGGRLPPPPKGRQSLRHQPDYRSSGIQGGATSTPCTLSVFEGFASGDRVSVGGLVVNPNEGRVIFPITHRNISQYTYMKTEARRRYPKTGPMHAQTGYCAAANYPPTLLFGVLCSRIRSTNWVGPSRKPSLRISVWGKPGRLGRRVYSIKSMLKRRIRRGYFQGRHTKPSREPCASTEKLLAANGFFISTIPWVASGDTAAIRNGKGGFPAGKSHPPPFSRAKQELPPLSFLTGELIHGDRGRVGSFTGVFGKPGGFQRLNVAGRGPKLFRRRN